MTNPGVGGADLRFNDHPRRKVRHKLLEGNAQVGVLQQSGRGLALVNQNHLETVPMPQVTQLAGKVHISCTQKRTHKHTFLMVSSSDLTAIGRHSLLRVCVHVGLSK